MVEILLISMCLCQLAHICILQLDLLKCALLCFNTTIDLIFIEYIVLICDWYIVVWLEIFHNSCIWSTFMQHGFIILNNLPQINKTSFRRRSFVLQKLWPKNFFLCSSFVGYHLVKIYQIWNTCIRPHFSLWDKLCQYIFICNMKQHFYLYVVTNCVILIIILTVHFIIQTSNDSTYVFVCKCHTFFDMLDF